MAHSFQKSFLDLMKIHLTKRKTIGLAILSGVLLSMTVYPAPTVFLVWLALVPLLLSIESASFWKAFGLGLITGLIYYSVLLSWINYYNVRIFLFALAVVLFFIGVFAGTTSFLLRRFKSPLLRTLVPPLVWVGLQYLYSLTSFGSAGMDLETIQSLAFLQLIAITGVSSITFAFLWSNGLIAYGCITRDKKCSVALLMLVFILGLGTLWGHHRLSSENFVPGKVKVACIQPNFPVDDTWRYSHTEEIFETYREMAQKASQNGAQLIVFPQYMLPIDVYREPARMAQIARDCKAYLILGTYTRDGQSDGQYNIALIFSPDGKIVGDYRAVRPPPFRRIGQVRGRNYKVVDTPWGQLGLLLCYDDVESQGARALVKQGAEILVTLMNNGHFKKSKQLHLHLARDVLRAVEAHRFVIRSATTGISAVIDPYGNVLANSRMQEREIIYASVSPLRDQTFFMRRGDLFKSLIAFVLLILCGVALRRRTITSA